MALEKASGGPGIMEGHRPVIGLAGIAAGFYFGESLFINQTAALLTP